MTDAADDILTLLPARLRAARRDKGLSLEAVAKLSGVSRSMVSQIERGESSPTIATLWNLTKALQVDFAGLLDSEGPASGIDVIRAAQAPRIENRGAGCRIIILSPPEEAGTFEMYEIRFDAGGALISAPHRRGAREQITVIEGTLDVTSGEFQAHLGEGATARNAAELAHTLRAGVPGAVGAAIARHG